MTRTPTAPFPSAGTNDVIPRPEWLPIVSWPHPIRSLDVGGEPIAYTDVGRGPVIVLAHTGMWSFVWHDVIARLADVFRVVALDAPGTGLSGTRRRPTLEHSGDAIDALVRHLDLGDVTLAVHDLGGPAALHAAAGWPDRVAALVAVNSFGWRPSGAAFRAMLAIMGSGFVRELDVVTGWLPRLTSTKFGVGRHLDRSERRTFRRGVDRRSFHRYLRSARRHDYSRVDAAMELLADRPLLTVFGERNDPLGFQPEWASRFPDTTQVVVPGGNHFPMCDDPDLVAGSIVDWHRRRFGG